MRDDAVVLKNENWVCGGNVMARPASEIWMDVQRSQLAIMSSEELEVMKVEKNWAEFPSIITIG